ncbi:MAG: hypothetical protein V8S58_00595 [Lachnospiraceae bacterium]
MEIVDGATKMIGFVMMNMDEAVRRPGVQPGCTESNPQGTGLHRHPHDLREGTMTPYYIIQDGFMGSKGERPDDYTNLEAKAASGRGRLPGWI